jgi:crotonobetaine/carnitine-CoA ligase
MVVVARGPDRTNAMTQTPTFFSDKDTVPRLLEACARQLPEHVCCRSADGTLTYSGLNDRVNRAAHGLLALGVKRGMHVAVMLGHHLDHIIVFFALMKLGAVQIPINIYLKGPGLTYLIEHAEPLFLIADHEFSDNLQEAIVQTPQMHVLWRARPRDVEEGRVGLSCILANIDESNPGIFVDDGDIRSILYTSGTTGPAKGVVMTDRMFRAAALGSIWIGDIRPGSVLHFWDPIYHVFGSEVLVLSVMVPVTLALVPRFSASRLWDEVREYGATHIHFVGGVLQLLLKQPLSPHDKDHTVRVAWGGGCPLDTWPVFENRFGVTIREGYGMTETSSFSTINTEGKIGSIGKAVAYFNVEIVDETGRQTIPGEVGEIRVSERERGVMVERYHKDPATTASTIRDGWLYTGDLAYQDAEGFIFFLGRKKDSLRRRGENISAWEVERVVNDHPLVEESALIGVRNEIEDEDLKLFVKLKPGNVLTANELLAWCEPRMPAFQIPRFVAFVREFRKTPTQRIQKQFLSRVIDDGCFDREVQTVRSGAS